jgi:hypothetical protein
MNILNQDNQLEKLIKNKFFGDDLHPHQWKGLVKDVDYDGTKFDTKVVGALRVRILGLHDFIEDDSILPIVLPFWLKSGFRPTTPEVDDFVFVIFENIEPIGQGYWTSLINPIIKGDVSKTTFVGEKKPVIEEVIPIQDNTITKRILELDTYFQDEFDKNLIVIHHTVSKGTPKDVADYWNNDGVPVATAYIIGLEGDILQTFDSDKMWAWHLKVEGIAIEKRSIGIELINIGPVAKTSTGYMDTYGKTFDGTSVEDVGEWRDFRYFIKYTDKQYKSLSDLINHLCSKHNIPKVVSPDFFTTVKSNETFNGIIGHISVRSDKTDVHLKFDLNKLKLNLGIT